MERVVLVTDTETRLGSAILDAYNAAGERAIGIPTGPQAAHAPVIGTDDALTWNRFSAVDPRNIMISTLKRYKTIDEVLVVQSVESEFSDKPELVDINKAVDYWIKGNMFFVREVLRVFAERGKGALVLVNHSPATGANASPSPIGETVRAAYSGYINALVHVRGDDDICINGFEALTDQIGEFAQFIHKNTSERLRRISGKLLVFHNQGPLGLFVRNRR